MSEPTEQTIQTLTQLCRIHCTEEEQHLLLKDLKNILQYIDLLNELDTSDVTPCNHVLAFTESVTREDVIGEVLPRDRFLANAPDKVGGLIRVPPVIKSI